MGRNVRLQTLRISHEPKLSQRETADKAGLSLNRYWMIENGHAPPSVDEQRAIADVFRVGVQDAFPSPEAIAS
jgi:transcriptional regulator with XRE-family HTH domain